jgi:ABC-type glycerol-3-phosphate transport system substrate-binding protein
MSDDLDNIVILPDDRIICTNQSFNFATREATNEIIIFTKTLITDLPGRILLTLAAFALDNRLKNAVIQFNRTNSEYRIQVVDYLDFRTDDDWFYGLTMLSLEIISGKIPDILVVQNLPFNHYIARGFIEDLYPFIDNDIEIDRNDFVEGVLRTSELDGKLYQIFPSFFINTILGHPSILGMGNGWNVDEFLAVLEANPQADVPMGEWLTKESFLMSTTLQSIDEYVDWVSGTVNFDSGAFAELLELADTFPAFIDWGDGLSYDMSEENIATGRQIMASALLSSFDSVKNYRNLFGGEIVYKGLPTENRNGNTMSVPLGIAMTTTCKDKDGAWEFMRTLLTKEWQLSNIFDFPVNKAAFNIKAENAMIVEETPDWWFSEWGVFPGLFPLTQNEFEQVIELVNSLSGIVYLDDALMDIVREGANDFFNGRYSTAQEAARVIQSRAAILVAEQMG